MKEALLNQERLLHAAADLECDAFDLVREAVLELLESEAGKVLDRPLSFRACPWRQATERSAEGLAVAEVAQSLPW